MTTRCRASPTGAFSVQDLGAQLAAPLLGVDRRHARARRLRGAGRQDDAPAGARRRRAHRARQRRSAACAHARQPRPPRDCAGARVRIVARRCRRAVRVVGRHARSIASSPTCPAPLRGSCGGTRTASGCAAPTDVAGVLPRSRTRSSTALWPLLAPGGRCSTRPARCSRPRTRRASPHSWRATPMRCANPSSCPADVAHAGGQLLPSSGSARATITTASSTRCSARPDAACSPPAPVCPGRCAPAAAALRSPACRHPYRSRASVRVRAAAARRGCCAAIACAALRRRYRRRAADSVPVKQRGVPRRGRARSLLNVDFELVAQSDARGGARAAASRCTSCSRSISSARAGTGSTRRCCAMVDARTASRYKPLTRQYRVASGPLGADVRLAGGGRAPDRPRQRAPDRARERRSRKASRYDVVVRLRLDQNQLPKPFQVNALASREWQPRVWPNRAGSRSRA